MELQYEDLQTLTSLLARQMAEIVRLTKREHELSMLLAMAQPPMCNGSQGQQDVASVESVSVPVPEDVEQERIDACT